MDFALCDECGLGALIFENRKGAELARRPEDQRDEGSLVSETLVPLCLSG